MRRELRSARKRRGGRGIAAEQHAVAAGLDQVAVVSAICIAVHARAPMIHFEGAHPMGPTRVARPIQVL